MKLFYILLLILTFIYSSKGEVYCSGHGCDGDKCLPLLWVCDGSKDCDDGSDEAHCDQKCKEGEIQCLSGGCIPESWRCDGLVDCPYGSDERNCSNVVCEENKYSCPNSNICIEQSLVCDGFVNCPNGSDESKEACKEKVCPRESIKCDGGLLCVPHRWVCNHINDCADGMDEINCTAPPPVACQNSEFQCDNFDCISEDYVCDSFRDCQDGSDEKNCDGDDEGTVLHTDVCSLNNGGCSHICNNISSSKDGQCQCFPGYQLNREDGHSCLDVDECLMPGMCSQLCENLLGSFRCACSEGFVQDPIDNSVCHIKDQPLSNIGILVTVLLCLSMLTTMILLGFALMKKWKKINSKKVTFHGSTSLFQENEIVNMIKPFGSLIITSEDKNKHFVQVA